MLVISGGNELTSFNNEKEHKLRTDDIFFKKAIEQNIPILGI